MLDELPPASNINPPMNDKKKPIPSPQLNDVPSKFMLPPNAFPPCGKDIKPATKRMTPTMFMKPPTIASHPFPIAALIIPMTPALPTR